MTIHTCGFDLVFLPAHPTFFLVLDCFTKNLTYHIMSDFVGFFKQGAPKSLVFVKKDILKSPSTIY